MEGKYHRGAHPREVHMYKPDMSNHTDTIALGHTYKYIPLMIKSY
jgi:hypothetical protein